MSYRNPGNIPIADPNAFINAFNQGIQQYKQYYEEKAEKRKKELEQIDVAKARFSANMNYPDLVKQYGAKKVDTIKNYVNEKYLNTKAFANATTSQRQEMLNDLSINLLGNIQKAETAATIDPTDIDLSVFDSTPEYKDFLLNQANGYAFSLKNGVVGYEYKDEGNNLKFISADQMPDKLPEIKTKTQIYTSITTEAQKIAERLDGAHRADDSLARFDTGLSNELARLFANLMPQEKAAYWEKAQISSGIEESNAIAYNDFPESMPAEELKKNKDIQEMGIMSLLKEEIKNNSAVYNKFVTEIIKPLKPETASKPTEGEIARGLQLELGQWFDSNPIDAALKVFGGSINLDKKTGKPMIELNPQTGRYQIETTDDTGAKSTLKFSKEELFTEIRNKIKGAELYFLRDFRMQKQVPEEEMGVSENNDFLD